VDSAITFNSSLSRKINN